MSEYSSYLLTKKPGDKVVGGDVIGTVQETPSILHKIMIHASCTQQIGIEPASILLVTVPQNEILFVKVLSRGRH